MGTHGRQGWAVLILLPIAMVGCGSPPSPAFPTWQPVGVGYVPLRSSGNAYDRYALAAEEAERTARKYADRVYFTPGMKEAVIKETASAVAMVRQGAALPCEFRFVPHRPFEQMPYHRGWRLIEHALVWSIEKACQAGEYDAAISNAVVATKFGFDLTGGGALEASLGLTTADDVRKALAPYLLKMGAKQLGTLSAGIKGALEKKPPMALTIRNERLNMLAAVQAVQDAYRDRDFKLMRKKLGSDVREAIQYLEDLRSKDEKERPAYFNGFAEEANLQADWDTRLATVPANQRTDEGPRLREKRPWRRFAKQFFHAPDHLLAQDDATVARTKLLILHSEILRQVKSQKKAPLSLSLFTKTLTIDPFTGLPFLYRSDGPDYKLYSVGSDFKDDGGATDETFSLPDMQLETKD
jgi:hypothetical protein